MKFLVRFGIFVLGCVGLLVGCASQGEKKKEEAEKNPFGPTGIPKELRGGGKAVEPGGNQPQVTAQVLDKVTPQDEIVWTNPDDPDAGIPGLGDLVEKKKSKDWLESPSEAKLRSMRENKPMLLWFTDSLRNAACAKLREELFDKKDFNDWVGEKVIPLRMDSNGVQGLDATSEKGQQLRDVMVQMKRRYKILGAPVVLVLAPNGEVMGRFAGYKAGQKEFQWGLIRHAVDVAQKRSEEWRGGLAKSEGYRVWSDRRGNEIFAKLLQYGDGKMSVLEPNGGRAVLRESELSDGDQQWLLEQKKVRGL